MFSLYRTPLGKGAVTIDIPRGPPTQWIPGGVIWDGEGQERAGDGGPIDTAIDQLRKHVRAAMIIEFTTIPLYLYAVWSIKPDNGGPGTKARYSILGIVQQEMLHLALVGNIARALNYEFRLYNEDAMAVFDGNCEMLYDKVQLNLERAKKHLLGTFVKIEAPYTPPANHVIKHPESIITSRRAQPEMYSLRVMENPHIMPEYHSIGEFYTEFRKGLKQVAEKDPKFLNHNKHQQFRGEDFYGDQMVVVKDLDTALQAMDIIVDQGEGSVGVEDSHYRVFLDLYRNRDMWECWPVAKNPRTDSYKEKKKLYLYYLSRAFDACYCYLLCVIDDIWYDKQVMDDKVLRHKLVRCMHPLMMNVLTPLAEIMVQQELEELEDGSKRHAGPCFELYTDEQGALCTRNKLRRCIQKELKAALDTPESKDGGFKGKLEAILFTVEHSLPPEMIEIGNNFLS